MNRSMHIAKTGYLIQRKLSLNYWEGVAVAMSVVEVDRKLAEKRKENPATLFRAVPLVITKG